MGDFKFGKRRLSARLSIEPTLEMVLGLCQGVGERFAHDYEFLNISSGGEW